MEKEGDIDKCLADLLYPEKYREDAKRFLKHGRSIEEIKKILIDPNGSFWALHRGEFPYSKMSDEEFFEWKQNMNS